MSETSPTAFCREQGREITVCDARDHTWAEGDESAIYCEHCTGHICPACLGDGQTQAALGRRRCHACSGLGVVMWWEPEERFINPHNWAKAAREEADRVR